MSTESSLFLKGVSNLVYVTLDPFLTRFFAKDTPLPRTLPIPLPMDHHININLFFEIVIHQILIHSDLPHKKTLYNYPIIKVVKMRLQSSSLFGEQYRDVHLVEIVYYRYKRGRDHRSYLSE